MGVNVVERAKVILDGTLNPVLDRLDGSDLDEDRDDVVAPDIATAEDEVATRSDEVVSQFQYSQ